MPIRNPQGLIIQDEGVSLAIKPYLNFVGGGITAAVNGNAIDVTVAYDTKVAVDAAATGDYLGAAYNDGALRTDGTVVTYTDGGNYVTLTVDPSAIKLDDLGAPDDNTDLDFSTSAHGLVPKGTNTGNFLKDDGTWSAPAGGGDVIKVGTPANDQVGVWTGDGTIEGDGDLTFAGQTLTIGTVDTDEGILVLNADTDAGGKIQLHVEGDSDDTIATFDIAAVDDDLHIGPSTDTDMLKFNDSTSIQATKPLIGTTIDATTDFTVDGLVLTADTITNDAALTVTTSAGDISVTPAANGDVNVPANIGVTFGDDGEKIEGDGTDLTIASSAKLNLTATSDVIVPVNVGVILGDGAEKLESDNTDLTVNSGGDINLTATADINVPANIGMTFGDDGEKIEGDGTDLTIASSAKLNLTATSDVIVPVNVGVILGDGAENLESDNTDLTINSGGDINLTATSDINVPANIGVTFGDDGEKIEGDGSDLTIASSGVLNLNATTSVTFGGNVVLGEHYAQIDSALSADGTYSGIVAAGVIGYDSAAFGQLVYLANADGRWEQADADAEATAADVQLALVISSGASDGDACVLLLYGYIREDDWDFTSDGDALYVSTTAAAMTATAPSASADIVRVVGYQTAQADTIFFNPSGSWVEIS